MDEIFKLLNVLYSDNKLYWVVPSADGSRKIEVIWIKGDELPWRVRDTSKSYKYIMVNNASLEEALTIIEIDKECLIFAIKSSLLQEAVYIRSLLKQYTAFLGQEKLDIATKENEKFLNDITGMISNLLFSDKKEPSKKRNLTIVKDEN